MDSEYQLDLDITKMCRSCLSVDVDKENLKNFFCSDILDGSIVAFPKVYEHVTDIRAKRDDKLPDGICIPCKAKISEFYSFKQKCVNSNELLCKILDVPVEQTKVNSATLKNTTKEDKSTQWIDFGMKVQSTQTHSIREATPHSNDITDCEPTLKRVPSSSLKVEKDGDSIEIVEQNVEECTFDYVCTEYVSADTYVMEDAISVDSTDATLEETKYKYEVDNLQVPDSLAIIDVRTQKQSSTKRSKRSKETCNICKVDVKATSMKLHRNLHQQTLPMILDSIPYFRCGRCKTVFSEMLYFENHFLNNSCCCNDEERSCTDYQYLEEFPEGEAEEEGPFSGCRTLRLCSVLPESNGSFICESCNNFTCMYLNDMLVHCVNEHFDNDEENNVVFYDEVMSGAHRCGVCQLNQSSLSTALRHVFFHLTNFICPVKECEDEFSEFKLLNLHIEQIHLSKENIQRQRCMHCGEVSENYQAFRQHQRKECPKKIYRCDVCAKKFYYKSSLSMHMKYHLNARFTCEVCNKSFSQLCDYKVHYRIHSGEKPYKCEFCDKQFRSISNRKDHMSTHRTDKVFVCEICHQMFKSERTLRGHYPIHNKKKFKCNLCDKAFHRRFHLTLHFRIHAKKEGLAAADNPLES